MRHSSGFLRCLVCSVALQALVALPLVATICDPAGGSPYVNCVSNDQCYGLCDPLGSAGATLCLGDDDCTGLCDAGGPSAGTNCATDDQCSGFCAPDSLNAGAICVSDFDCGLCTNAQQGCATDADCPAEPAGMCLSSTCINDDCLHGDCLNGDCLPRACGPDFCETPESCVFDGIRNVALGQAQLALTPSCNLVVSNIGSSGEDGVRQDPLPLDSAEMVSGVACPNFAASGAGTQARFRMLGDVPGELLSELTVTNLDGITLEADADFSPAGVTFYTIQIMIGDHFTANVTNLPSGLVTFPKTDLNEVDCLIDPPYHISYELTWVSPITIPGVGTFDGNVVWIIGQNPTVAASRQTAIVNLFQDTGPVEMTFQYAGPVSHTPQEFCGPSPENESCCQGQLTPGCTDPGVCGCVCAIEPRCCTQQWDASCAALVQSTGCGGCQGPCCAPHPTPGCDDPALAACVCAAMPLCCAGPWSPACVNAVNLLGCGSCAGPCAPDVCPNPAGCIFDGIPNVALGQAQLSLTPGCSLVVSNIGSSGEDGVRQEPLPPGSQEMVTGMACPNFAGALPGTEGRFRMFGDVPGGLISELGCVAVPGDVVQCDADFSPAGVTSYTVQVMVGDHFTANLNGLPQGLVTFPKTDLNEIDCLIDPPYHISYELTCVQPITVPGVGTFEGNVIWIIGENPTAIATQQTRIDNLLDDTGPIEMTFQYAGPARPVDVCGPDPNNRSCCEAQISPGCTEPDICACVCAAAPECCILRWDAPCSALVEELGCASCPVVPQLSLTPGLLSWTPQIGAVGYDVVHGDLLALGLTDGDFIASTLGCLGNDVAGLAVPTPDPPPAGGLWFLVTKVTGAGKQTYDSGGPAQVGDRDAEIAASGNDCP